MLALLRQKCAHVNVSPPKVQVCCNEPPLPARDHESQVIMYPGYSEFKSPLPSRCNWATASRGNRKSITAFSPRARNNLLKKLFSLSQQPSIFITLTYPQYFPADSHEWKRHLDNFRRVFMEKFPSSWFYWKLEPQRRGAPHYHLLGNLGEEINLHLLRKYIANLWFAVCDTGDFRHLCAGTSVEQLSPSAKGIQAYTSKYIGKVDTTLYAGWAHPGRFWGIIGRVNLPEVISIAYTISKREFYTIRRMVKRWLKGLSPGSRKYSRRIVRMPSFFVFAPRLLIDRMCDAFMEPVPF